MDPSVLQLFSMEEILHRLGHKRASGCVHIFTQKEAANVFFKEGVVIAAAKGLMEGEEVLKQVLEWKDARAIWQWDPAAAAPPLKALQINVHDFISKVKPGGVAANGQKDGAVEAKPLLIPVSTTKGKLTGSVTLPIAPPPDPTVNPPPKPVEANGSVGLTATKNIGQSSHARSAQEEALLNKHRLTLVSLEDAKQRIKISRVSCLIGRNPACDITLNHSSISRQHCLMQITERGLHVKDLGTTNGTRVNGIGMTEGYISVGDKLTMGHLVFALEKDTV